MRGLGLGMMRWVHVTNQASLKRVISGVVKIAKPGTMRFEST